MIDDTLRKTLYRTVVSYLLFHKTFDHSEITIIILA